MRCIVFWEESEHKMFNAGIKAAGLAAVSFTK